MNSEYALIKLLMTEPHQVLDLYRKGFRGKHFKNPEYGKAYRLIYKTQTEFSSIPTTEELKAIGVKIDSEPVPHTIKHCANQILEEYNKQEMRNTLLASGEALVKEGPTAAKKVLDSKNYLIDLEKSERSKDVTELSEEFLEKYNTRAQYKGNIIGVPTGFEIFDRDTMGLQNQWLITIAGRNASFKTWVLASWALNAWRKGFNVAIFSCEMSMHELLIRIHSLALNVTPSKVQYATMDSEEYARLKEHLKACEQAPWGKLIINDNPTSMSEVEVEIQNINETVPLDIVFIDSAYRMNASGDSDVSRQSNIARAAKNLAKKHNIPVVCSVQLNRDFAKANATDKTKDKTTSGGYFIHGTDAWNQDSDIVLALNRPENYNAHNYSDFITDKFRHGKPEDYILEINLAIPRIAQVDTDLAKSRITGVAPPATQRASQILTNAENALMEFRAELQNRRENGL
jgi:replicative DNA helicase